VTGLREAAVTEARCLAVLRAPAVMWMAAGEPAGQTVMPGSVVRGLGHQLSRAGKSAG
jgi:hypothetical protein